MNIREYPENVVIGEPVHRIHLGIGSPLTWHGAPDGRCAIDLVNVDAVEEEEDSSGSKTPVEIKMSAFGRPNQVLGTPSFSPSYNRTDTQQKKPGSCDGNFGKSGVTPLCCIRCQFRHSSPFSSNTLAGLQK